MDNILKGLADARAAQIKASLQRISWQAEDLAEALGVPREEKYDVWAALYGDDRTVFAEVNTADDAEPTRAVPAPSSTAEEGQLADDSSLQPLAGDEVWNKLEHLWAKPVLEPEPRPEHRATSEDRFAEALVQASDHGTGEHIAEILVAAERLTAAGEQAQREHNYRRAEALLVEAHSVLDHAAGPLEWAGDKGQAWRSQLVRVELDLVSIAYHRGDVKRAVLRAEKGLRWVRTDDSLLRERVRFLIWLGELYAQRGLATDASAWIREARQILDAAAWTAGESAELNATCLRVEGMIKVRLGDWQSARDALEASLQVARTEESLSAEELTTVEAYVEREYCYLCIRQGVLDRAIEHAERSYELRKKLGQGVRAQAQHYAQIAEIYRAGCEEVDERLRNALFSAIEGFEELGDDLDTARTHLRLARLYRKDNRPRDARYWARRALEFGQRADLPLYQALAHRQYGMALELESYQSGANRDQRDALRDEAEQHLRKSLAILATLQDSFEHALSQRTLGAMLARRAREEPARYLRPASALLEEARTTFQTLGATLELEKTERTRAWLSLIARQPDDVRIKQA